MVRTLANVRLPGSSSSSSKSLKKGPASSSSKSSGPSEKQSKDNLPVNHYCPRETPSWQKQITHFFERSDLISSSNKENIKDQQSKSNIISDDNSMNIEEASSMKRKIDEVEESTDTTETESVIKKPKKFKHKNRIIDTDDESEEMEE